LSIRFIFLVSPACNDFICMVTKGCGEDCYKDTIKQHRRTVSTGVQKNTVKELLLAPSGSIERMNLELN